MQFETRQRQTAVGIGGIAVLAWLWMVVWGGAASADRLERVIGDLPWGWPLFVLAVLTLVVGAWVRSPLLTVPVFALAILAKIGVLKWVAHTSATGILDFDPRLLAAVAGLVALFVHWNANRLRRKGIARALSDEFYRAQGRIAQAVVTGRWWSDGDVRDELIERKDMQRLATAATSGEWRRVCSAHGWLETLEGRRKAHLSARNPLARALDEVMSGRLFERDGQRWPSDGVRDEDLVELARTYDRLEAARFELRRLSASLPLKLGWLSSLDENEARLGSYPKEEQTTEGPLQEKWQQRVLAALVADRLLVWFHRRIRSKWHRHQIKLSQVSWELPEHGIHPLHLEKVAGLLSGHWSRDKATDPVQFRKSHVGVNWTHLRSCIDGESIQEARNKLPGEKRDVPAGPEAQQPGASPTAATAS